MSDSTSHPSQDEVSSQPRTEGQVPLRFPETVMIRMMHKNNSGGHVQNQSSEQSRSASISSANNPSPLKRVTNVSDLVRPTSRAGSDEEMDSVREPSAAVAESSESEKPVQRLRWRPSGDLMDRDDGEAFDLDDESSDAGSLNFDEMPSAVNTARLRQEAEPSYISARDFGPAEQPAEPPLADLPEGSVKKEVKGKVRPTRTLITRFVQLCTSWLICCFFVLFPGCLFSSTGNQSIATLDRSDQEGSRRSSARITRSSFTQSASQDGRVEAK